MENLEAEVVIASGRGDAGPAPWPGWRASSGSTSPAPRWPTSACGPRRPFRSSASWRWGGPGLGRGDPPSEGRDPGARRGPLDPPRGRSWPWQPVQLPGQAGWGV